MLLLGLMVLFIALSVATNIWMLVIIFKRSIVGGLLSLFFGLPVLYFLVTGWGKEDQDIKKPFFLSLLLAGLAGACAFSTMKGMADDVRKQLDDQKQLSAPATRSAPSFREPSSPPAGSVRISNPPEQRTVAAPQQATGVPRPEAAKPAPRRQRAQSDCVYKPVMTDEDLAKCR